jgi:hypothetical protein
LIVPADFQNNGEAQQAGWTRTKSAGPGGQGFQTVYELQLAQDRQSGHSLRVTAYGNSGGEADAKALASLNAYRRARYGFDDVGPPNRGPRSGQQLVPDRT